MRPRLVLLQVALAALALACVFPFAWMIAASVKEPRDTFRFLLLPHGEGRRLTLEHFRALFETWPFARWMAQSLFIASTQTVLVVLTSSLGGFALAKYRFRGRDALMFAMLLTMLVPAQVVLPGSFELMRALGWLNSYRAIILPGGVSVFGVFLFMQAMRGVPDELLASARLDGCGEWRLWWSIALPLVRPMVGAFALLSFLAAWNAFLWPQMVLQDEASYPLAVGLGGMVGLSSQSTPYGVLMAGTLLSVLPVAVLFFVLQREFVGGLTGGAVKG